jgi:hypothetical protein
MKAPVKLPLPITTLVLMVQCVRKPQTAAGYTRV